MTNRHSQYAILSIAALGLTLVLFALLAAESYLTKYSAYEEDPFVMRIGQISTIVMIVSCLLCLTTAVIALRHKESSPVLPTVSLSVFSFFAFFVLLMLSLDHLSISHAEKGIVTNSGLFDIPQSTTKSGKTINLYDQRILLANTDQIPARIGTSFGFNYVVTGEPTNGEVDLVKITRYPDPGVLRRDVLVHADTVTFSKTLNRLSYSGFKFDYDYELVPGKWQIEMWNKQKLLLSKTFYVQTSP